MYWAVAASLIGGGAMGAIITAAVSWWRNRIQPVAFAIEYQRISGTGPEGTGLDVQAGVRFRNRAYEYQNLTVVQMTIANSGNRDIREFSFGVTLGEGEDAIFAECEGPDRHNTIELADPCTPEAIQREIDFLAHPFNRRSVF